MVSHVASPKKWTSFIAKLGRCQKITNWRFWL
jgi:hypothetical protein